MAQPIIFKDHLALCLQPPAKTILAYCWNGCLCEALRSIQHKCIFAILQVLGLLIERVCVEDISYLWKSMTGARHVILLENTAVVHFAPYSTFLNQKLLCVMMFKLAFWCHLWASPRTLLVVDCSLCLKAKYPKDFVVLMSCLRCQTTHVLMLRDVENMATSASLCFEWIILGNIFHCGPFGAI